MLGLVTYVQQKLGDEGVGEAWEESLRRGWKRTFMNELLPIRWYGLPLNPSRPLEDFDHDPCVWYWYKDPGAIPDEYWRRYGLERARG